MTSLCIEDHKEGERERERDGDVFRSIDENKHVSSINQRKRTPRSRWLVHLITLALQNCEIINFNFSSLKKKSKVTKRTEWSSPHQTWIMYRKVNAVHHPRCLYISFLMNYSFHHVSAVTNFKYFGRRKASMKGKLQTPLDFSNSSKTILKQRWCIYSINQKKKSNLLIIKK